MNAVVLGARFALRRAVSRAVVAPLCLVIAGALWYSATCTGNADSLREQIFMLSFRLVLPVSAFLLVDRVLDKQRFDSAVWELGRYGFNRSHLALGLFLGLSLAISVFSALCPLLLLALPHGLHGSGSAWDLLITSNIALAVGPAYAAGLLAASQLGPRGGGRKWVILCDIVFGRGLGWVALPWPQGHFRNLLGGSALLDLSQTAAWGALFALTALYLGLALSTIRR